MPSASYLGRPPFVTAVDAELAPRADARRLSLAHALTAQVCWRQVPGFWSVRLFVGSNSDHHHRHHHNDYHEHERKKHVKRRGGEGVGEEGGRGGEGERR